MTIFLIYVLPMLITAFGGFGLWCTEPEGKIGLIASFLFMFIPGLNVVTAMIYLIATFIIAIFPSPVFYRCINFWKFLFGENSIID